MWTCRDSHLSERALSESGREGESSEEEERRQRTVTNPEQLDSTEGAYKLTMTDVNERIYS